MALAYEALTEKQQKFVMSQIGEESKLGKSLAARIAYITETTSAITVCNSAEAANVLTKLGLSEAEAQLLLEKVKQTLQTRLQTEAVEELTQEELKQIIVETAAANKVGNLTDAQAGLFAQFLKTQSGAENAGKSISKFGGAASLAWKSLIEFIKSPIGIITLITTVVYAAITAYDKLVLTAEEVKAKSDEISEDVTVER